MMRVTVDCGIVALVSSKTSATEDVNPSVDSTRLSGVAEGNKNHGSEQQPKAEPSSRYHSVLQESANTYPLTTEALMRSDRHRLRRWEQFVDPVDLVAIESLLSFLKSASDMLSDYKLARLDFLPTRIADDVRMALEGLLSGYLQTASDAMRDAMETELLIRDFALDTRQIQLWRDADERVLSRSFRPVHLRQRQAHALGVPVTEVPGADDYRAHSMLLHVREPLLFQRSPESGHLAVYLLDALGEIMFHGASVVEALVKLFDAIGLSGPESSATLSALRASSDDIGTARAATVGLEIAIKEGLPEQHYASIAIFENGLVVAITEDKSRADFFSTDRVDFRRFHRDVASESSAPFTLNPLGSSPRL